MSLDFLSQQSMTKEQRQAYIADTLLCLAEAEEMRRSLKAFVTQAWHIIEPVPYRDGWCVDAICEHLEALTSGAIRFLLINIPPRHSKSTICSVLWPAWCWLHNAAERFLCSSYGLNLAIRDNLKKRNLIESKWFQDRYGKAFSLLMEDEGFQFDRDPDFTLSRQQKGSRLFVNDHLGYQLAVSVGSTTTGEGGSMLLMDDPHSATEAHSEAERESANRWFRETWSNRMNDAGKDRMIVIGQRIHEQDVSGIILQERPDWVHLNLPAEYESARKCTTVIGWQDPRTKEGELLWPERFNPETIARYKRDLGSLGYAAQYQQVPVPASGGAFRIDNERLFTQNFDTYFLHTPKGLRAVAKSECSKFITVDPAISEKESADYTVIGTWAVTPYKDLLLLNVRRDHWSHRDQQDEIEEEYHDSNAEFVAVETVAYQLALFQDLLVRGIFCRPFIAKRDKVTRASGAAIWHENGKFYFLKDAHWLPAYQKEMYTFPKAGHDDQVDMTSLASIVVRSRGPLSDDDLDMEVPDPIEGPLEREEDNEIPMTEPFVPEVVGVSPLLSDARSEDDIVYVTPQSAAVDPFAYAEQVYGGDW